MTDDDKKILPEEGSMSRSDFMEIKSVPEKIVFYGIRILVFLILCAGLFASYSKNGWIAALALLAVYVAGFYAVNLRVTEAGKTKGSFYRITRYVTYNLDEKIKTKSDKAKENDKNNTDN